jgi:hypothetical protein
MPRLTGSPRAGCCALGGVAVGDKQRRFPSCLEIGEEFAILRPVNDLLLSKTTRVIVMSETKRRSV